MDVLKQLIDLVQPGLAGAESDSEFWLAMAWIRWNKRWATMRTRGHCFPELLTQKGPLLDSYKWRRNVKEKGKSQIRNSQTPEANGNFGQRLTQGRVDVPQNAGQLTADGAQDALLFG